MNTVNQNIKDNIKAANLFQYNVANEIGIAETTLVRWLRYELSKDKEDKIIKAINKLKGGESNG